MAFCIIEESNNINKLHILKNGWNRFMSMQAKMMFHVFFVTHQLHYAIISINTCSLARLKLEYALAHRKHSNLHTELTKFIFLYCH